MKYKITNKKTKKKNKKYIKTKYKKYIINGGAQNIPNEEDKTQSFCSYINKIKQINKIREEMKTETNKIDISNVNRNEQIQIISNELKNNININKLNLSNNKITNNELKILVDGLKYNTYIKTIDLKDNDISDEGVYYLIELLQTNVTIDKIDIYYNFNITHPIYTSFNKLLDKPVNLRFNILKLFKPILITLPEIDIENNSLIQNKIQCVKELIVFKEESGMTFDKKIQLLFNNYDHNDDTDNFSNLIQNNYISGMDKIQTLSTINSDNLIIRISLHGITLDNFFQLPKNVNIVFLSPVSYLTCINDVQANAYLQNNIRDYLQDPSCFNKKNLSTIFNESVIYYGGQYCINTRLSREVEDHVLGILIYEPYSSTFSNDINLFKSNFMPPKNLTEKEIYKKNLDEFITEYFSNDNNKNKNFTLFFTSCRELTDQFNKNYLVFYEQTIKILNYIIYYDSYINKDVNKITDIAKYTDYYNNTCIGEVTDFYLNNDKGTIFHVQHNKSNSSLKLNNLKSSKKIIIADTSKLYIDKTKLKKYTDKLLDKSDIKENIENKGKKYVDVKDIINFINIKLNITPLRKFEVYVSLTDVFLFDISWTLVSKYNSNLYFSKIQLTYFNLIKYILKPKLYIDFIFWYIKSVHIIVDKVIYMRICTILIKNFPEIYTLDEIIINNPIYYDAFNFIIDVLKNNKTLISLDLQKTQISGLNIDSLITVLETTKTNLKKINLKNNNIDENYKKKLQTLQDKIQIEIQF